MLSKRGNQVGHLPDGVCPRIGIVGRKLSDFVSGDGQQTGSSPPADSRFTDGRGDVVFAAPDSRGELVPIRVCVVPSGAQPGQGQIPM